MPASGKIQLGDLEFNYLQSGDPGSPLILLLHGFPESSYMWRTLMDELASQGYHCIAPDLRGYSPNACPKGRENYTIDKLAQDVVDIASHFGGQFHLIAHDWGAGIGWYLAYHHRDSILSYSALSVPHNRAFGKAYRVDKVQKKMSRYIVFFQLPMIPEWYVRRNDLTIFKRLWKQSDPDEVEYNLKIFRNKKSLTAAINYYRANVRRNPKGQKLGKIEVPTLFIWGKNDFAVSRTAAEFNHGYMSGPYQFLELDAGHWLIQSKYDEVKEAILGHLESVG